VTTPTAGWPATADELVAAQRTLAAARPPPWEPAGTAAVGASACCFGLGPAAADAWAAACRCSPGGLDVEEVRVVAATVGHDYAAGLLALREGALRATALRRLAPRPDVVLVNATGRDHPRRAGLALHLGAVLGVPTVGVTDRPLLAGGDEPDDEAGATAPLRIDGDVVGHLVRTRPGARPIAVHAAWRTTPDVAAALVLDCVLDARTPEPLRHAGEAARRARAR
jgi:deoxyribonuclease V